MRPERFRRRLGFALCASAPLTLLTAAPALSQGLSSQNLISAVPIGITLGAGAFALLGLALVRRIVHASRAAEKRATEQVASLRAMVVDYVALRSGTGEITVVWGGLAAGARFLGPASAVLPSGRRVDAILDFDSWLGEKDAAVLADWVRDLRSGGQGFDMMLTSRDGRNMRAIG